MITRDFVGCWRVGVTGAWYDLADTISIFFGRDRELADLRAEFDRPRASLPLIHGRRRVGESTLLQQACAGRRCVCFQGDARLSPNTPGCLHGGLPDAPGDDGILGHPADWFAVLNHLAHAAEQTPGLVMILDEFLYLAEADPALPSVAPKFFDSKAPQHGHFKLVPCGSAVAGMKSLPAQKNPLYGRQSGLFEIGPLPLREAAGCFAG